MRGWLAAVLLSVVADLSQQQGLTVAECLQPPEIGPVFFAMQEVDVETEHIQEGEIQILCTRIIGVGDEPLRVDFLDRVKKRPEELLHSLASMPTDDRRRNLVADAVHQ